MEISPSTPQPKKILLADDDPYISRAYSFALGKAGFEVIKAFNGKEVLTQALANIPDLILLDQIMPEMDGFETLAALKNDPKLAHIPVILFTNLEQPSDVERGRALGAVDYVIKAQVTMKEVVEKAKQYIVS